MKTKKRRVEYFSFYNHTGIEAHFSQMAKKGWMIESISNLFWTYRKIEPQDVHFCVSYYPRASDFDPGPSEEQQTFHDFCAHTGWKLACTWHQIQVFYNEKEAPVPLDTDPIMEVDTLHRACKKNFLPSYFILLALSLFMSCYFVAGICLDPIGLLSNSSRLIAELAYLCLFAISSVELFTYFAWYRKAKKEAQNGIFVDTPSTSEFQKAVMAVILVAMVWWIANLFEADDPMLVWVAVVMFCGMIGVMLLVNGIKQGLKKAKVSRGWNRILTLAACFVLPTALISAVLYVGVSLNRSVLAERAFKDLDPIPFSVSDFRDVNGAFYVETSNNHQTFLLGRMIVDAFPHWDEENSAQLPDLWYSITTVKVPFLYDWCKAQMFRDSDETDDKDIPVGHRLVYIEQDPSSWGAKEAYRLYEEEGWYRNWYLLCYEGQIIEIRFDWEPTIEDMDIVNQKMNP